MNRVILLSAIIFFGILTQAQQKVVFKFANEDYTHGDNLPDIIEVQVPIENFEFEFDCFIANTSDNSMEVKMRREIVSYVSGAEDQLCWGTCTPYNENDFNVEKGELSFAKNETKYSGSTPVENFPYDALGGVFHYQPNGQNGTTELKYTLISVKGGIETVEDILVIKFTALATSVSDKFQATLSKPYPNPATAYANIDYAFDKQMNARLAICNVIGKRMAVYDMNGMNGTIRVNTTEFPSGIYFLNIESDGRILTHQKLIKR